VLLQGQVGVGPYYLFWGITKLIQAQDSGERLLHEGLLGKHRGNPIRSFFVLGWIQHECCLSLLEFGEFCSAEAKRGVQFHRAVELDLFVEPFGSLAMIRRCKDSRAFDFSISPDP
jgi:hypothetical protein